MKEKKGRGKFVLIFVFVLVFICCFGVYLWNKDNNAKLSDSLREPALDYFDKYMSSNTGAFAYRVTLKDLRSANDNEDEEYDLSSFEGCDDVKTYVTINIDYANGKVTSSDVKLSCKKF